MINNYIEQQDKLQKLAADLYNKDRRKGTILSDVLDKAYELDKESGTRLSNMIIKMDKNLYVKSNFIQKIILNNVLVTHVLKLRAGNDVNLTPILVLLSYKIDEKDWKKVVIKNILPFLIKNDFL